MVDRLSDGGALLAGALMLAIAVCMSYEAFMRHFLDKPTSWVFALSILVFVWYTFLSTPYGIKEDKHVTCDVFVSRLPERTRQVLGVGTDITTLAYIAALGVFGYRAFADSLAMGSLSEGLVRYPMWLVQLTIPLGMALSFLQTLRKIHNRIQNIPDRPTGTEGSLLSDRGGVLLIYGVTVAGAMGAFLLSLPLGILVLALVLLFWGVPIAFALGGVGLTGLLFFHERVAGLNTLPIVAEHTATNFVLLAIPLFTLGGLILSRSGLGEEIYELSSRWLGWMPGGLGVATCITGGVLAAMIGSSTAVTAIVTLVAMKPLLERGYDKTMVIGTVTGSSLGLIIPPSVGFIVYGYLTDTSVGELFMAGVVPGALLVLLFSGYVVTNCSITKKYEKTSHSWKDRFLYLRKAGPIVLGPVFVLGSIYTGIATPTEAGAILVIYSLLCSLFFKKMTFKTFHRCLVESSALATMIIVIMIGALTMSNVITLLQVPSSLAEKIFSSGMSNVTVMVILVFFYLILGMFLDGGSITVLTVPVIAPMLPYLGIDTVAFGVILMVIIEAALLTPPVGLNLFTVKGIVEDPLSTIIRSVLPFLAILLFVVVLLLVFPEIALWLPAQMR